MSVANALAVIKMFREDKTAALIHITIASENNEVYIARDLITKNNSEISFGN